jgi:hypothetical protein
MDEENDRKFCIWSRGYTPSLNVKSALRKDLKKMMGRELTQLELDEFDLEGLIGFGVKLIIQHEHKDDKTYANISFIAPDKDSPLKASGKYVRINDRDTATPTTQTEAKAKTSGWESVIVHVGKYKGKKLGEVDEVGVATLIEKWLPQALAGGKKDDAALVAALTELADILNVYDF